MTLALALTLIGKPVLDSLTLQTPEQKQELLGRISPELELTALAQVRKIDPDFDWISVVQTVSPRLKTLIKENAIANLSNADRAIQDDSNLSWLVEYKGKQYRHNWNDDYDTSKALVSISYQPGSGDTVLAESTISAQNPTFSYFNSVNVAYVDPSLVEEETATRQEADSDESQQGDEGAVYDSSQAGSSYEEEVKVTDDTVVYGVNNEYVYHILLPEGFRIEFYIPAKLNANGGPIARRVDSITSERIPVVLAIDSVILLLVVLLSKKSWENKSFLLKGLTSMKALFSILTLVLLTMLGVEGAIALQFFQASGVLRMTLMSYGIGSSYVGWVSWLVSALVWFFALIMVCCDGLYVKYVFSNGIRRYLKEDTLTAHLVSRSRKSVQQAARKPLEEWSIKLGLPMALFTLALILLLWFFTGLPFPLAMLLALFGAIFLYLLIYRAINLIQKDFNTTCDAANQLAQGNFSDIQPANVGAFQKLYNQLLNIRQGFETALKDGLASQKMKAQLISNVSHDLKTPITGIKSYAELIGSATSLEDAKTYAARLEGYTDRLNQLIEDLFDVTKANSGDIQLNPVSLDLCELLYQVEGEWEEPLHAKNITVVTDLPESAPTVLDPNKTMRIIDNLMSNANKYAMEGTRLFISLKILPASYVLEVKNISKEPMDFNPAEITERFVRGDSSRHESGSGLGLAIVKSFMEIQNGSCTIQVDGDVFKAILIFPKDPNGMDLPDLPASVFNPSGMVAPESVSTAGSLNAAIQNENPDED